VNTTSLSPCVHSYRVLLAAPAGSVLHGHIAHIEAAGHSVVLTDNLAAVEHCLAHHRKPYDVVVIDSSLRDWSASRLQEWHRDAGGQVSLVVVGEGADVYEMCHSMANVTRVPSAVESSVLVEVVGLVSAGARKEREYKAVISQLRTEAEGRAQKLEDARAEVEKNYRELKDAQSQLLQSEKLASIGQLAAGVAHEINNPIGFIYSNMNTLGDYVTTIKKGADMWLRLQQAVLQDDLAVAKEHAEQLEAWSQDADVEFILEDLNSVIAETIDGAERVKKTVMDLRTFSRAEDKQMTTADINRGIESTVNVCWNELKYHCDVVKNLGDIPEILCYPMKLNQVFMNLIINAAQSIEDKGTVTIRTRYADGQVVIEISDTGSGIPEESLDKIFDPFFTTKPVGKGTGLGLSIVYNIVAEHKGEISVASEVGRGTTFTISLPVQEQEDA